MNMLIDSKRFGSVVDTTDPTVSSFSPLDGASNVAVSSNFVITFDEAVTIGTGNITIVETGVGNFEVIPVGDARITGGGTATITINPTGTLASETDYHILVDATCFDDLAGNSFAGISSDTTWNFTSADINAPTISTLSPVDGAVAVGVNSNFVITFSEDMTIGTGDIRIVETGVGTFETIPVGDARVTGAGTDTITINPTGTLGSEVTYHIEIDATCFDDLSGNSFVGITNATDWNFVSEDTVAPTISTLSPTDGATGVLVGANFTITFDEAVAVGTGDIRIVETGVGTLETIPVGDARVTGGGTATITINPTADLVANTAYHIEIDATGFDDLSGNSFAGITNATTWNFVSEVGGPSFPSAGMVLYLDMDEASGTLNDQSVEGNDSASETGLTYGATGKLGDAIDFDGSTSRAEFGKPASLDNDEFAISVWVKFDSFAVIQSPISRYWSTTGRRSIWPFVNTNGTFNCNIYEDVTNITTALTSTSTMTTGVWKHLVMMNDPAGNCSIYIDGVLEDSDTGVVNVAYSAYSGVQWIVGAASRSSGLTPGNFTDGVIDQVAMWDRVLTAQEITDIYNSGNGLAL